MEQNAEAVAKEPLPAGLIGQLDAIAAELPCRPYSEPFGLGWHMGNPLSYKGPGPA